MAIFSTPFSVDTRNKLLLCCHALSSMLVITPSTKAKCSCDKTHHGSSNFNESFNIGPKMSCLPHVDLPINMLRASSELSFFNVELANLNLVIVALKNKGTMCHDTFKVLAQNKNKTLEWKYTMSNKGCLERYIHKLMWHEHDWLSTSKALKLIRCALVITREQSYEVWYKWYTTLSTTHVSLVFQMENQILLVENHAKKNHNRNRLQFFSPTWSVIIKQLHVCLFF